MKITVATAAYEMDFLHNFASYEEKLMDWVSRASEGGADLALFPEYGAMELATLDGREVAFDLEMSLHAVSKRILDVDALHRDLARRYNLYILAASAPVFDPAFGDRPVNRARLFAPSGAMAQQDKQIMTRFERETWNIAPGGPLQVFDTEIGRVAVLICYDCEFPLLGRAVSTADILLVPSCTEARTGYHRVRTGAMARALENQCVAVMSSTVGSCDWSQSVEENSGMGGVFGPPDTGFPDNGVIAEGSMNTPGWTFAEIDLETIAHVRRDGVVLNRTHWTDQIGRDADAAMRKLR